MQETGEYHKELKRLMDEYVHVVYAITRQFPKEEMYGVISQLRRAALSVILNYVEGYARAKSKVHQNFLETSYGSLKESQYLLEFSYKEHYCSEEDYQNAFVIGDRIGKMVWGILRAMKQYEQ